MADLNLTQNRYFSIATNCTFLHTTGGAANRYLENPLKPAEFQVFRKDNLAWRQACRFWVIPLGSHYPCFDKAVEFEGATIEVLANRNQPETCREEKRRQLKQTVEMPNFEEKCQTPGEAS